MENTKSEDLIQLKNAVSTLAKQVAVQSKLLENASDLCLEQMQADTLSKLYTQRLQKLLENLKREVIPPLQRLGEDVKADHHQLIHITNEHF